MQPVPLPPERTVIPCPLKYMSRSMATGAVAYAMALDKNINPAETPNTDFERLALPFAFVNSETATQQPMVAFHTTRNT
ncbi:hypothetical protein LHK_01137 [Laribacter hongkongensis HLHK9]|uniref:Uncharacterized protein n=1 Tax=Laribacter hongkongensis (strain HLHK9) TaxID=557598 RepID=C1D6M2_LARHH|nr:hypothetical protein LHK_01137 [Laribacter hongkongensis HLHK9]